jgi:predicted phosphodiesterase
MKRVFLLLAGVLARGELLTPVWVELGENGRAIARVVAAAVEDCPRIQMGGASTRMTPRQPVPQGFSPACELALPPLLRSARVNGQELSFLRPAGPSRIVVLGDTGCRVKGERLQACKDSAQWPFEQVAGAAASARPNLIVHVGDYLYREDPCPPAAQVQCGGTPWGDNWNAWNADFFKPVAKLLGAAPWVFVRGNHEDCQRAWRGWFYYLDPHAWAGGVCPSTPPPYTVQLGDLQLIVFDSSAVSDAQVEPGQRNGYAAQLASLHGAHAWLLDHHPFFGIRPAVSGQPPVAQTVTLQEAWDRAAPQGIDMILSGHTHLFEVLSYGSRRPIQIVAGDGGTNLDSPLPEKVNGMDVDGAIVTAGENQRQFGYLLFSKSANGWNLALKSPENRSLAACRIQGREASCQAVKAH